MSRRTLSALAIGLAALCAVPAMAQDAPISTAAATPPPAAEAAAWPGASTKTAPQAGPQKDVSAQIADYLASSPAASLGKDETPGVVGRDDEALRDIHGEVSVAVGSHGYRSVYARSDIPIGKTGQLSVAVQDSRGGGWYGGPYGGPYGGGYPGRYGRYEGQSLGVGLSFGDGASARRGGPCSDSEVGGRRRLDMADDGFTCRPSQSAEPLL